MISIHFHNTTENVKASKDNSIIDYKTCANKRSAE